MSEPTTSGDRTFAPLQTATLAGGCFWCTEAVFLDVKGVQQVESGYIGGSVPDPSYKQVCGGQTGHAEAIRISYDPSELSYQDLLGIFFATHDPTQLNRQGYDTGTQYRSAVFYQTEAEKAEAQAVIDQISAQGVFDAPIVTTLEEGGHTVIDGFHRSRVGKEDAGISARLMGYLPVTIINPAREGRADRIASTIRHNRARGRHQVQAMRIFTQLKEQGCALLMALHDLLWAQRCCDHVLLQFADGRVLHGEAHDLLTLTHLEALYQCPLRELVVAGERCFVPGV